MKQKDIALLILIVFISGLISYFVAKTFISSPKNRSTKVEVVEAISSDFKQPNPKYFNAQSVNPTKLIQIGDSSNQTPFQ